MKKIIITLGIITSVALGSIWGATSLISSDAANDSFYPKNEKGLTYGSTYNVSSYENFPDLILVVGVNGKTGYVYRDVLYSENPRTDEELNKYNQKIEELKNNGIEYFSYPVYSVDGEIEIDEYRVYIGSASIVCDDEVIK